MADAFLRICRMIAHNSLAKGERRKYIALPIYRGALMRISLYTQLIFTLVLKLIFHHPFIAESLPNWLYLNIWK